MEVKCILNNHELQKTKHVKKVHNQPWFNDKIRDNPKTLQRKAI